MKILLILALCILALWGGYEAAMLYDRSPAPSQDSVTQNPAVQQDKVVPPKAEPTAQVKPDGPDVGKGVSEVLRLRSEIENEKAVIEGLETRVREERTSLASGAKGVLSLRRQGLEKKRAALAETQAQLRTTQEDVRVLREQLRDRVALGWTMDQVNAANSRLTADLQTVNVLSSSLQQIRSTDYSAPEQQAVSARALNELRADLGQAQASLADERKKLEAMKARLGELSR